MSTQSAGSAPTGPPTGAPTTEPPPRPSIGLTVVMILLVLLAIAGAICALLGFGGAEVIEIIVGDFTLKTESVGLGVMALALLALVGTVKFMPTHVTPFADRGDTAPPGVAGRVERAKRPLTITGVAAIVVAVIIAIIDH